MLTVAQHSSDCLAKPAAESRAAAQRQPAMLRTATIRCACWGVCCLPAFGLLWIGLSGLGAERKRGMRCSQVLWVERRRRVEFFNLFAAEMTQNSAARRTDMWSRGLHGEGQTIGIGDTGIDHDNCFFRDPMVPVPIGRVDPRHRKIVAYWPDSDSGDALGGHGTHVAGSAVGQSISPEEGIDRINGIAWAAKVAFTDMDPLSVSGGSSRSKSLFWELCHRDRSALPTRGIWQVPDSLDGTYFGRPYSAGARVHSDSWGSANGAYDGRCRSLDRFVRLHPDFLSVTGNPVRNTPRRIRNGAWRLIIGIAFTCHTG